MIKCINENKHSIEFRRFISSDPPIFKETHPYVDFLTSPEFEKLSSEELLFAVRSLPILRYRVTDSGVVTFGTVERRQFRLYLDNLRGREGIVTPMVIAKDVYMKIEHYAGEDSRTYFKRFSRDAKAGFIASHPYLDFIIYMTSGKFSKNQIARYARQLPKFNDLVPPSGIITIGKIKNLQIMISLLGFKNEKIEFIPLLIFGNFYLSIKPLRKVGLRVEYRKFEPVSSNGFLAIHPYCELISLWEKQEINRNALCQALRCLPPLADWVPPSGHFMLGKIGERYTRVYFPQLKGQHIFTRFVILGGEIFLKVRSLDTNLTIWRRLEQERAAFQYVGHVGRKARHLGIQGFTGLYYVLKRFMPTGYLSFGAEGYIYERQHANKMILHIQFKEGKPEYYTLAKDKIRYPIILQERNWDCFVDMKDWEAARTKAAIRRGEPIESVIELINHINAKELIGLLKIRLSSLEYRLLWLCIVEEWTVEETYSQLCREFDKVTLIQSGLSSVNDFSNSYESALSRARLILEAAYPENIDEPGSASPLVSEFPVCASSALSKDWKLYRIPLPRESSYIAQIAIENIQLKYLIAQGVGNINILVACPFDLYDMAVKIALVKQGEGLYRNRDYAKAEQRFKEIARGYIEQWGLKELWANENTLLLIIALQNYLFADLLSGYAWAFAEELADWQSRLCLIKEEQMPVATVANALGAIIEWAQIGNIAEAARRVRVRAVNSVASPLAPFVAGLALENVLEKTGELKSAGSPVSKGNFLTFMEAVETLTSVKFSRPTEYEDGIVYDFWVWNEDISLLIKRRLDGRKDRLRPVNIGHETVDFYLFNSFSGSRSYPPTTTYLIHIKEEVSGANLLRRVLEQEEGIWSDKDVGWHWSNTPEAARARERLKDKLRELEHCTDKRSASPLTTHSGFTSRQDKFSEFVWKEGASRVIAGKIWDEGRICVYPETGIISLKLLEDANELRMSLVMAKGKDDKWKAMLFCIEDMEGEEIRRQYEYVYKDNTQMSLAVRFYEDHREIQIKVDKWLYRYLRKERFISGELGNGLKWIIARGFTTPFSAVPSLFDKVCGQFSENIKNYLEHLRIDRPLIFQEIPHRLLRSYADNRNNLIELLGLLFGYPEEYWRKLPQLSCIGIAVDIRDSGFQFRSSQLFKHYFEDFLSKYIKNLCYDEERNRLVIDVQYPKEGNFLLVKKSITEGIRHYPLPAGKRVAVVVVRPNDYIPFAGNLVQALSEENTVRVFTFGSNNPGAIFGGYEPDIILAPRSLSIQKQIRDYLSGRKGEQTVFYYPSLESSPEFNLCFGFNKSTARKVAEAVKKHESQQLRRDYQGFSRYAMRYWANLARYYGFIKRGERYANVFTVGHIREGMIIPPDLNKRYTFIFGSEAVPADFIPIRIGKNALVLLYSPHPDDMEIAEGGVVIAVTRTGKRVHNIVYSSGGDKKRKRELSNATKVLSPQNRIINTILGLEKEPDELAFQKLYENEKNFLESRICSIRKQSREIILFVPHRNDAHYTHRKFTSLLERVWVNLSAEYGLDVIVAYYFTPSSGDFNTYFLSSHNLSADSGDKGAVRRKINLTEPFKRATAITAPARSGQSGKGSPDWMHMPFGEAFYRESYHDGSSASPLVSRGGTFPISYRNVPGLDSEMFPLGLGACVGGRLGSRRMFFLETPDDRHMRNLLRYNYKINASSPVFFKEGFRKVKSFAAYLVTAGMLFTQLGCGIPLAVLNPLGSIDTKLKAMYNIHIERATKTIELNPEYAEGYYSRAAYYVQLKKFEEARQDYAKAIELNPQYLF
ncbi:MAG: PIG-L family deacetylase, partial [Candidatus Omnitrophota bacterium]